MGLLGFRRPFFRVKEYPFAHWVFQDNISICLGRVALADNEKVYSIVVWGKGSPYS